MKEVRKDKEWGAKRLCATDRKNQWSKSEFGQIGANVVRMSATTAWGPRVPEGRGEGARESHESDGPERGAGGRGERGDEVATRWRSRAGVTVLRTWARNTSPCFQTQLPPTEYLSQAFWGGIF
ncbi:hypothetical protein RhiTH_008414 [Rhizoctonia solani]